MSAVRSRMLPLLAAGLLATGPARAQALRLPAPPAVRFDPAPGARLPLDAILRDEQGAAAPLRRWFGAAPVVLVPGYYRCPNLCGTVFEGVLQALALSGLRAGDYTLLGVSVDPREDARVAAGRRAAYAGLLPPGARMALLTGDADALARVGAALGYVAAPDAASGQLAHAAGFVVAAPDGRVVRLFPGVRFDPGALREAVLAARGGGAAPGVGTRLLLLCAHYDPATGRYTGLAMLAVRTAALLVLLALAWWMWRRPRSRGGAA